MSSVANLQELLDAAIALRRSLGLPDLHDQWSTVGLGAMVTALRYAAIDVSPLRGGPGEAILARISAEIVGCVHSGCRCPADCDQRRSALAREARAASRPPLRRRPCTP